ncbi:MAG: sigma-70 family RNA polymerase sigma factor [Lachnospiraceae bacterium]|nr:sigma-70 family RNA polymerase sigma factor [Lachnospiraceae bacterium]
MEKSSSCDELIVRKQLDRLCKLALKRELIDYYRHENYLQEHEKLFSELSETEWNQLVTMDDYGAENCWFQVLEYDIEVKDRFLAESLKTLTEEKRNIILFSYYLGMSDAEIGRRMHQDRTTIREHRLNLLEKLKVIMEKKANEEKAKKGKR